MTDIENQTEENNVIPPHPPTDPREEIISRQKAAAKAAYDAEIELSAIELPAFIQGKEPARMILTVMLDDGDTRQFEISKSWLQIS